MYSLQVREFEDIKPFIDNRADVVNNIGDFYQKQPTPISILAKFTKENVVELWQYLLSNKAIKVNVNTPSYQSKEPTKNNNGYIVDAITLYLIFRLEVHNNIKEYLDNIAIVQGTLDLFFNNVLSLDFAAIKVSLVDKSNNSLKFSCSFAKFPSAGIVLQFSIAQSYKS
jgi:hypothetical protein